MEAKATVMTEEEQDNCTPTQQQVQAYLAEPDDELAKKMRLAEPRMFRTMAKVILYGRNIAQVQAEITFKAGIREVVEWMNEHHLYEQTKSGYYIPTFMLQAKLKEWGII